MSVEIREATESDSESCGRICYEAFKGIADRHHFPPDFPNVEAAVQLVGFMAGHPSIFGVVAEKDGKIVGSNFLDQRDRIAGVGPITVAPDAQGQGVGRKLMEAVMDKGRTSDGVRLLQDAHNPVSLSLYASLGFDVKEPVVLMNGRPGSKPTGEVQVRRLSADDLDSCAELCRRAHGFDRTNGLRDTMQIFPGYAALRDGRIRAYASTLNFWPLGHGVAETGEDMKALMLGAAAAGAQPLSLLLPHRQSDLFRWCLGEGLRTVKPMTVMAIGPYQEPEGCWFPSVLY